MSRFASLAGGAGSACRPLRSGRRSIPTTRAAPRPADGATAENPVYVREDRHGRGIGRASLKRLVEEAGKAGFRQMIAVIGDAANRGSIRLQERADFDRIGSLRSVALKHEQWLDTVLMQRALGPGDSTPRWRTAPPAAAQIDVKIDLLSSRNRRRGTL